MAGSNIVEVTDRDFADKVKQATGPVLVDFWAPWCGPCRMIGPIVEELAGEYGDRLTVAKMNTDDNAETAVGLGIRSIPTLILFHNGEEVDRMVGFMPKEQLKRRLDAGVAARG